MFFIFQVLNETSLWWFDRTRHITSNAVVASPDKNVTIAKKCSVFPVEFVGELFITRILISNFLLG
jgi:phosphoribosylaminoimidazole-succinocarboxamide synthase